MLTGRELAERLQATSLLGSGELRGCSKDDITRLEQRTGLRMPEAYKDFLRAVGRNPGPLMWDCEFCYDDLPDLDTFARSMLAAYEGNRLGLPPGAFVWETRQPEQFMFFVADGVSDDPPVFHYFEEQGHFEQVADSIWVPIAQELVALEEATRNWPLDDPHWQSWRHGNRLTKRCT
jgi:SMI1 / KNR4 family (SUKH-1)